MTAEEIPVPDTTVSAITQWHAHVYFDTKSAPAAECVRNEVLANFDIRMGRWHEKLVGPHPRWSYQIAFPPELSGEMISWLALNRRGLTVFIHPETGDDLIDHTQHTVWMGEMLDLNLDLFRK